MVESKDKNKATSKDLVKIIDEGRSSEIQKMGSLKQILNIEPPKKWLSQNQFTRTEYLPISKVEVLLDSIFQEWRVEVLDLKQLAQSVVCTARVHYRNPITSEWSFHDGVGAVDIQTKKGHTAADLGSIVPGAIQKGAPAAKSYAIKDAAEHIGKIFGRDLNRKDSSEFYNFYGNASKGEAEKTQILLDRIDLMKKYTEYASCTKEEAALWVYRLNDWAVKRWLLAWAQGERPALWSKDAQPGTEFNPSIKENDE